LRELEDLKDLEDVLEGLGGFEGAGPGSADYRELEDLRSL
jgi:hypothetical protein